MLVCRNMDAVSADKVAFVDCPINYAQLMHGIKHIKAKSVRAIFYQNDNVYIDGIPSREVFAKCIVRSVIWIIIRLLKTLTGSARFKNKEIGFDFHIKGVF